MGTVERANGAASVTAVTTAGLSRVWTRNDTPVGSKKGARCDERPALDNAADSLLVSSSANEYAMPHLSDPLKTANPNRKRCIVRVWRIHACNALS